MEEVVFPTCHRCGQACPGSQLGVGVGWPGCSSTPGSGPKPVRRSGGSRGRNPKRKAAQVPLSLSSLTPSSSFSSLGLSHANPCPAYRLPPPPQQPDLWPHQELRHPSKLLGLCPHHALCLDPISLCVGGDASLYLSQPFFRGEGLALASL